MATERIAIEVATPAHAVALAGDMRLLDVEELEACGQQPLEAVEHAVRLSEESWVVLVDGEVAAMFGVVSRRASMLSPPAAPSWVWLLTGHAFGRYPLAMVRTYRNAVQALVERYGGLINYIDCRYQAAVRVALLAGFSVGQPVKYGLHGQLFNPVVIWRN